MLNPAFHSFFCVRLVILALTSLPALAAQPYLPESEATVVAVLSPSTVQLAASVRAQRNTPSGSDSFESPAMLLRQIVASYELAVADNSDRAYGHTLQLLSSWPVDYAWPPLLGLIKASVLQHSHEFHAALGELARLLAVEPAHEQALTMRAQINLVVGDYDAVADDCARLLQLDFDTAGVNCQAQLAGLTGRADFALDTVEQALQDPQLTLSERVELHLTGAMVAWRLDAVDQASRHFSTVLSLVPDNRYLLTNYSEWLLEQGEPEAVLNLLEAHAQLGKSFELQMIHAQALLEAGHLQAFAAARQAIDQGIDAMSRRTEERPFKLIARHALVFQQEANLARQAALANWEQQREPSDLWLLAQTAALDGHQPTLQLVADWIARTGLQDHRLQALLSPTGLP